MMSPIFTLLVSEVSKAPKFGNLKIHKRFTKKRCIQDLSLFGVSCGLKK
nr:unnamed protein product [Callosobruchus chinensis]